MQHGQRQMCSVRPVNTKCYRAAMQPEQKIIARWMSAIREKHGWSFAAWAEKARIGSATTLTRAMKPDYESITSVKTLHQLAEAAGERSILDFLADQTVGARVPAQTLPSVETLATLLAAVLPLAPAGRASDASLKALAEALRHGLELLGEQQAIADHSALGVASRGVIARFRDLNS
jgi:hypothetical protein